MANDFKVLYRKYRPTSFDQVIGQKYTINMLKNAVINNKISHAYIFTGPRGTGKTSTAKIFAKTINCEHSENGLPCNQCNSCLNYSNNADIIEIDAASNNGVDEIRELINNVKVAPSFSKYKVYIIDEVHMLSQSAFNALLLTLEEPPSHIVFILATTNIENVPITILSRCQRYDFKKIGLEDIIEQLKYVSSNENIDIVDEALQEIAYLSDGGMRDALSILNQLYTSNSSITLETVTSNYGSISSIQVKEIVNCVLNNDFEGLNSRFKSIIDSSLDYKVFIKKLIDYFFEKGIQFKSKNDNSKYDLIKSIIYELNDILNKINININPFLMIFICLLQFVTVKEETLSENPQISSTFEASDPKISIDPKANSKQLEPKQVEFVAETKKMDAFAVDSHEKEEYLQQLVSVRLNNCFAQANKACLVKFKKIWDDFKANVSSCVEFSALVIDSEIVMASENINLIVNSQESIVNLFNNDLLKIEEKYKEFSGNNIKLISLSTKRWNKEKEEYISKIKSNYKYELMNEPEFVSKDENSIVQESKENGSDSIEEVLNIFDKNKIEIK